MNPGYLIDEDDQRVDLITVIYRGATDAPQLTKAEVAQHQVQAVRFFDLSIANKLPVAGLRPSQNAMVSRLQAVARHITDVRVFILTDGVIADAASEGPSKDTCTFKYEVWDLRRVYRCMLAGLPYESIRIELEGRTKEPIECLRMPCSDADYEAYLCMLPGTLLNELYNEFGSRLLELNVRSFLQVTGAVNRAIRTTINSEPHRFLAYNNGISATAEAIEVQNTSGGLALKALCGLQIVNGGQTMASLHRAAKIDRAQLSQVYVQAKITVIPPSLIDDLVPKISRYANSQNKVSEADFSSNDPFHVELQRLSEVTWVPGERSRWFYERARGQYQVARAREGATPAQKREFEKKVPPANKITKTDLAKYTNSWDQLPHVVGRGAQKNFVDFMDRLRVRYGKDWKPDQAYYRQSVAKAMLFKLCEKIARDIEFPAYRANAVTYTIAYLSHRVVGNLNFEQIWQQQAVSEAVSAALRDWMPKIYEEIVTSAGTRNVTEWCKKEACWDMVRSLDLAVPDSLRSELSDIQPVPNVGAAASQQISFEDRERIARIMKVPAGQWLDIHGWGSRTGSLKGWQCGIALTLSGYASGNWEKIPSAKQAKHALDIIDIASQEFEIPV